MFPLEVKSGIVARAPIVTPEDTAFFVGEEGLQAIVLEMLDIMLCFYGLKRGQKVIEVDNERLLRYSLRPYNHNLLRISRILRSLRLLGCETESIALFKVLEASLGEVEGLRRNFAFWHKAVYGPFEFPGTADGPPGAASQQPIGASGTASGAAAGSIASSSKQSASSFSIKPCFSSKRKARPEHLQIIRSSTFSNAERLQGLDAATSIQTPGSTDSSTTSDNDVDASRKGDGCIEQRRDSRSPQRPVSPPCSSHPHVPDGSSCANGSGHTPDPKHDRDQALGNALDRPGSLAGAMQSSVMERGQHDASGHASAPALPDSREEEHMGLQVNSQPSNSQKLNASAPVSASSTPAADMKSDGPGMSHIGSCPGTQITSTKMPFTRKAAAAAQAQQVCASMKREHEPLSQPNLHHQGKVADKVSHDHL